MPTTLGRRGLGAAGETTLSSTAEAQHRSCAAAEALAAAETGGDRRKPGRFPARARAQVDTAAARGGAMPEAATMAGDLAAAAAAPRGESSSDE